MLTGSVAWSSSYQSPEALIRGLSNYQGMMDNIHELSVRPDGKELWASSLEGHNIVIVDIESPSYSIVGEIQLSGNHSAPTSHVIFSPDSRYAYLTDSLQCQYEINCTSLNFGDLHRVLVIDAASKAVTSIIPMQSPYSPTGSHAVTPDGRYLYIIVTDSSSQQEGVYKLDLHNQQMVGFLEVSGVNFITLSSDGRYLYVTRGSNFHGPPPNLFSVIDVSSFQVISSVSVGNKPWYAAITPDGGKAYIANDLSNNVTVVDLSTMQVKAAIAVGGAPKGIAITLGGRKAYVGNWRDLSGIGAYGPGTTVSLIDAEKDLFVKNIPVGLEPASVVIDPRGTRVFVSDGNANGLQPSEVHVIDAENGEYQRSIIVRKPAVYTPTGIDVTPEGRRLFVISEAKENLLVIDTTTHTVIASFAIAPRAVKVSLNGQYAYVYCARYPPGGRSRFFVIDTNSLQVLKSVDLGLITTHSPWDSIVYRIALNSTETTAYLAGGDGDEVIVVDLVQDKVVTRIWVGAEGNRFIVPARGIAITPDNKKVFVSSCLAQKVSVMDTATNAIVATIPVADCPSEVEISPDGKKVYIHHQFTTVLMSIVDAETNAIIRVVDFPPMIAAVLDFYLTADEKYLYSACFDPNWVMVYDMTETNPGKVVKAVIKTRLDPFNVAVTADKRFLYVTNFTSDSISVIDTQTNQVVDSITLPTSLCTYTTSPANYSFSASAGTGSITVTSSSSSCSWTAESNVSWITVTSGSHGTGNGTITYSVAANSGVARTRTITISGQIFIVTQEPGPVTSIPLSASWNLISLPLSPSDTDIGTVLSNISGKYSIVWAYTNSQWKGYDPSDSEGSDLKTMEAGKGYWIKMTSSDTLAVTGTPPSTSLTLTEGWNLVGYNKTTSASSSSVLDSILSQCRIVWAYMNNQWKGYDPSDAEGSDLTEFTPGYGYWVKTTEAVEWQQ